MPRPSPPACGVRCERCRPGERRAAGRRGRPLRHELAPQEAGDGHQDHLSHAVLRSTDGGTVAGLRCGTCRSSPPCAVRALRTCMGRRHGVPLSAGCPDRNSSSLTEASLHRKRMTPLNAGSRPTQGASSIASDGGEANSIILAEQPGDDARAGTVSTQDGQGSLYSTSPVADSRGKSRSPLLSASGPRRLGR